MLYERYYDRVYRYCLFQLGSREEAEDVAQTTFMWAFRGLRRGVVPRAEASWLFTIAQNACRARHRARGRRREREVLSDPQVLADVTAAPAAQHDDLVGLEDALERMPDLQRRAILLREWRGLSYREIATELELSAAAVETLIFRARRSLAELLAGRPAPRRARRFAFDFGSIAAALKSFLGAGAGTKLAAGIVAIIAATTLAGSTEQTADKTAPRPPVPPRAATLSKPTVATSAPAAKLHPRRAAKPEEHTKPGAAVSGSTEPAAGGPAAALEQTLDETTDPLPVVADVTGALPLDATTDAVDSTLAAVAEALPPPAGVLP